MGSLFCSYYVNNRITRVRKAIKTSRVEELRTELGDFLDNPNNIMNISIDSNGNTPLLLSIEARQLASFMYILDELKVDPNIPNEFTLYTPLHLCCLTAPFDQKRMETSFRSRPKLEISKSCGDLTSKPKFEMKESIFSNRSENYKNNKTLLTKKLSNSKKKKMYESEDSAINSIGRQSNTESNNISFSNVKVNQEPINSDTLTKMINLLIEKGADLDRLAKVNRLTRMPGFEALRYVTPLHIAIYNKNLTAINLLIKNGANVNLCDPVSKISPLHMACYMSKIELVSALLQSKLIDVQLRSKNGFNCLHYLALSENDENSFGIGMLLMSNLIKKYESMYASNSSDFFHTCDYKIRNFVNQIGVEMNQTPLMFACMKNKLNLIKILLDYDADINCKDKIGKCACDYGKANESCVYLLNSFNRFKKITMKKKSKKSTCYEMENIDLEENFEHNTNSNDILSVKSLKLDSISLNSLNADHSTAELYKTSF
ncbi:unnamed protein product [Brachionus calyciflorus]|uniref:Uncharacterized protein n=1 Tax=Brachionus calyciflorus TaxID=104777 RepID=A0A813YZK1_9BILA|nr:unnamed protein product [Brachionus calyciflorus]